jgi:hypothetical protein
VPPVRREVLTGPESLPRRPDRVRTDAGRSSGMDRDSDDGVGASIGSAGARPHSSQ